MYNRYIPGNNGIYQRQIVEDPQQKSSCADSQNTYEAPPETHTTSSSSGCQSQGFLAGLDLGDVLLLCVILLLLLDADQDDMFSLIITAAAFILLQ